MEAQHEDGFSGIKLCCWKVDGIASRWIPVVNFGISGSATTMLVANPGMNSVIVEHLAGET
jgi:hypothetical protein